MELTGTERGFVLVTALDGKLRVEVADGFTPDEVRDERFRGSVGAVKQALETGGPVVVADVPSNPWLGRRPSVVLKGIGSLACLPLRREDKILGMIYVDSRKLGPAFTSSDIEVLESLTARAAEVLAEVGEYESPAARAGALRRSSSTCNSASKSCFRRSSSAHAPVAWHARNDRISRGDFEAAHSRR